jgi:hypothetical protein
MRHQIQINMVSKIIAPYLCFLPWGGVRLSPLGVSATIWHIVQALDDVQHWVEWELAGETEVLGENLPQPSLCPSQIPHTLIWARTQVTAERIWKNTSLAYLKITWSNVLLSTISVAQGTARQGAWTELNCDLCFLLLSIGPVTEWYMFLGPVTEWYMFLRPVTEWYTFLGPVTEWYMFHAGQWLI